MNTLMLLAALAAPPLSSEITLNAPPERAWEIFTTAEGWKMLGVAQAQVDFRVGGKILTRYEPGGRLGDEKTIENTILAYRPRTMLAIKATKVPAGFPFPLELLERTWSVIMFHDLGDGRTRVVIEGHGYGDDEASRRMRGFFEQGNAWSLGKLAQRLGAADDPLAPIEASASVAAGADAVFRALTSAGEVKEWLGVDARIELRPGGPYELLFAATAPEGARGSEGCEVLSWLPNRMLSFTWNAPPKFAHARAQRTVVVIELEPEAPGFTRVRLTHHAFRRDDGHGEEWQEVRAYFAKAWPNVLKALQASFSDE